MLCFEAFQNGTLAFGVAVAIGSVMTARSIARKKQTADLLLAGPGDELLQAGHAAVRAYYEASDKNIRNLATAAHFESEEARAVRYLLNHFEIVSVGIQAGIYDEAMIKRCWHAMVVRTWDKTRPLIDATRDLHRNSVLQEFEWLAKRWKKSPLKVRTQLAKT